MSESSDSFAYVFDIELDIVIGLYQGEAWYCVKCGEKMSCIYYGKVTNGEIMQVKCECGQDYTLQFNVTPLYPSLPNMSKFDV